MRSITQILSYGLIFLVCASSGWTQQPAKTQAPPNPAEGAQAAPAPETETIPSAPSSPALPSSQTSTPVNGPGFMDPAEVKALVKKIWLAEYRVNDLLTDLHPEKWKTSDATRKAYNQALESLRKTLEGLEGWRAQLDRRPDSIYYGFETYAAINAALPRLDGMGRAASQFENTSLGAQYSQAAGQLFDLQQTLEPYIAYLLRNPDQFIYVQQTNLAACQTQLGEALRGQGGPAKPLKNTFIDFHPRKRRDGQTADRKTTKDGDKKPADDAGKKTQSQPQPH